MLKLIVFLAAVAAGCGGDNSDTDAATGGGQDAAVGQPDAASPDAATADSRTADDAATGDDGATADDATADDAAGDAKAGVAGNTVAGSITYAGEETGNVLVALFRRLPPRGPPAKHTQLDDPTFPATFEINRVRAGTYQAIIIFDIGGNNPRMPGPEDVRVTTESFEVTREAGAWLDVEIPVE